jgi:hypothetical protein
MYCLPNDFREFLFQFFNNRLPLKYRIANFTDSDKWCTFCSLVGKNFGPFADETFYHFFVECPTSKKIHEEIDSTLFNLASPGGTGTESTFEKLFLLFVQFTLWNFKVQRRLPDGNVCAGEAIYTLQLALKINKKLRSDFSNLNCPLSRLWSRLSQPRW